MADPRTRIVLTADDQASGPIGRVTQSMGAMGKQSQLLTGLLGGLAGALSIGAITSAIKSNIDYADSVAKMSQRLGIAAKDLSGWQLAADLGGASIESVGKGVKGLATYITEYGDKLQKLGIDTQDPQRAMMQLADLFHDLPDGLTKTALATKLFGKAGLDMIPMLNQGSAGLQALRDKADAYGEKIAAMAPDAEIFNDQMTEAAFQARSAGANITAYFLPGLVGVATWLNDIATGGEKAQQAMSWLTSERFMKAMVLAGMMNGDGKRSVSGKIGGQTTGGLTDAEEEALGIKNAAALEAKYLSETGGDAKGKAVKKTKDFDPEGDFFAARDESVRKKNRAAMDAEEKAIERLRAKYIDLADPLQKYRDQIDEINTLRGMGVLTADQALAAEWEVNDAIDAQMHKMDELKDTGKDAFAGLTAAVESWGNKAADTFADFVVDGKASFSDLVNSMLKDIARLQAKKMLDPITKASGGFLEDLFGGGLGKLFGGSGDGGAGAAIASATASNGGFFPYFAGGGYTGDGSRSGGLDGQGGFLAVMHPRESVIDHTMGGRGPAGDTIMVNLNVYPGVAQTVRAEMNNMMPMLQSSILSAVMDARLRGGSARTAFKG